MSDNTLRAGHSPIKCPLHLRQVLILGMPFSLCDPTLTNIIGNQEADDAIPLKISSALVHHPAF
jgi:hypothetical protein